MTDFSSLNINTLLIAALKEQHILKPTPVQESVIPMAMQKQHIFFESETGTGKTLAFLLPLITLYKNDETKLPQILILTPTIELGSQIKEEIAKLQHPEGSPIKTLLCVGGSSIKRQINGLKEKPFAVIGTPSRILDLISLKKLKITDLKAVVLDEADRLLAKESRNLLKALLVKLNPSVQIAACSATLGERVKTQLKALFPQYGKDFSPTFLTLRQQEVLQQTIEHWAFFAEKKKKFETLCSLIHALGDAKILIFTAPAHEVETLTQKLQYKKIDAQPLYSKLTGGDRKKITAGFKSGKIRILVTSDLAARGLDIADIKYVIQLNILSDYDSFIHRAGRTGRAGKKGVNIVLGDGYELERLQKIEKLLNLVVYPKTLLGGKIQKPKQSNWQ